MADSKLAGNSSEPVELTIRLDATVYESFLRKAAQANMDVETFLSNTLTIVLGCRVFNETHACSQPLLARGKVASSG